jgi:hypothetical protein
MQRVSLRAGHVTEHGSHGVLMTEAARLSINAEVRVGCYRLLSAYLSGHGSVINGNALS